VSVLVLSLAFSEGTVELEFTDDYLQSEDVAEIRRMYLNREAFSDYLNVIEELLKELVDDAQLKLRNPPSELTSRTDDVESGSSEP
jgi:hypothetical protein